MSWLQREAHLNFIHTVWDVYLEDMFKLPTALEEFRLLLKHPIWETLKF